MKVITIGNQKGGVGKSTIACNFAVLAANEGKKVLLIDADTQASSMSFRAVREKDDIKSVAITQPTIHKDIGEFDNFDLAIIDAGGRDSAVFRSAITAATYGALIIPVLPSVYDIWATEDTLEILKEARVYVDVRAFICFNRVIARTIISKDARKAIEELIKRTQIDVDLLNSMLYSRVAFENVGRGLGVVEQHPNGEASGEMLALYKEVISKL